MTTAVTTTPEALVLLESKRQELVELAKQGKGLTIKGIDDKEGFALVHTQQMKCRDARVYLEKTRKDYTAQFDQRKASAIELERELIAIIEPVENALKAEKNRIEALKEEIKLEAERKAKEKLNGRIQELAAVNSSYDLFELEHMEPADFEALLNRKKSEFEAEKERIAKESEERAKYEAERATFEAEKQKLEAEKNAIQAEKDKIAREAEIEEARKQAAETARIETEARIAAEQKAKKDAEDKERQELESQEKFRAWLSENGVTSENKEQFEVRSVSNLGIKTLWKHISTYTA